MYYQILVCFPSLYTGANARIIYETFDTRAFKVVFILSIIKLHKRISIKTIREIRQLQNFKTLINVDKWLQ